MSLSIKYYIEEGIAARLSFIQDGITVTTFSIAMDDWQKLWVEGPYLEHQETNMVVNPDMHLKTWNKNGNRFIYFKFFETSIHAPLSAEADQTLWLFFQSIGKQWDP